MAPASCHTKARCEKCKARCEKCKAGCVNVQMCECANVECLAKKMGKVGRMGIVDK